jgi:hypothetical protein
LSFDGIANFDLDPHIASSSWFPDLTREIDGFPGDPVPEQAPEGALPGLPGRATVPGVIAGNVMRSRRRRRGERLIVAVG